MLQLKARSSDLRWSPRGFHRIKVEKYLQDHWVKPLTQQHCAHHETIFHILQLNCDGPDLQQNEFALGASTQGNCRLAHCSAHSLGVALERGKQHGRDTNTRWCSPTKIHHPQWGAGTHSLVWNPTTAGSSPQISVGTAGAGSVPAGILTLRWNSNTWNVLFQDSGYIPQCISLPY